MAATSLSGVGDVAPPELLEVQPPESRWGWSSGPPPRCPDPPPSPHPAFFAGTGLAGLLALGAVLSSAATVREARGLMAGVSSPCPQRPHWDGAVRSQGPVSPLRVPTETEARGCGPARTPPTQAPCHPISPGGLEDLALQTRSVSQRLRGCGGVLVLCRRRLWEWAVGGFCPFYKVARPPHIGGDRASGPKVACSPGAS